MKLRLAIAVLLPLAFVALAQEPPATAPDPGEGRGRGMTRQPPLRSAEILNDNKVTFRARAQDASEVTLNGNWPEGRNVAMTKDDEGVWSVTVGPLTPELWDYTFSVDGVRVVDPSNPDLRRDGSRYMSFFIIPGPLSENYSIKDVPHGSVNIVWYDSPTLNLQRRMYVYTPAGYESGDQSYPVLYLLHGAGGDEDAWNNMGRASVIMDNLIAAGDAEPMLVVMTNGNANQKMAPGYGLIPGQNTSGNFGNPGEVDAPGFRGRGQAPANAPARGAQPAASEGRGGGRGPMGGTSFPESLVNDVVPYIEANYRVIKEKDSRAIAGLSMGGGHTLTASNAHPEMFSYVGVFSMGTTDDITEQLQALKDAGLKFYYVGCGLDDGICVDRSKNLDALLTKVGINHETNFSSGGHTWANWRIYLGELAPKLFE